MPNGIEPEWLERTMNACLSTDVQTARPAWDAFAAAVWPEIMRIAIREQRRSWASVYSWVIAEDAAMNTYIKLMARLTHIEPARLFAWVRVVLRNEILTLRQNGFYAHEQTYQVDETWDAVTGDVHLDASGVLSVVERLRLELKRLSRDDRELLYARFWLEMPLWEIGKELGITHTAVGNRLKTVYKKLRAALTAAGYDSDTGATTNSG